ncbi:acetyl-CoA carboxylase biotin carboxyl carrier protein [Spirulina major CS-329]|uniref:acetyl-CoA carboxylase biotin carboxyl carrier protein n=1 Tax=Spirulina TaxID=1154 RepID=UPI00232CB9E6|nr:MULTISPECIES: acetyl-CoA carboxylase biotin carboxyl carrier protein [Spirulina]MDB9495787.1 acetyl-CoA carboxylase biotin carboxyl carrier protein [Spirulina subsalsa CS-330]MDB9503773.1 acetyl-CoA carboxylase biotin carboxyl carrier protein [Spirulina major CS-329]
MSIDFQEIRELLAAIAPTDITELSLKSEAFELTVKKGHSSVMPLAAAAPAVAPVPVAAPPPAAAAAAAPVVDTAPTPTGDPKWVDITSPMVGTFYRSPAPDEAPFVNMGDRVATGQTVCIIEAMKLMNEIDVEISGQIMEILVENGEPVEFGQPLMRVNPG